MTLKKSRKEYLKEYCLKNKEHRKEYSKEWYLKNKEHIKEYRLKNKERRREQMKEWSLKNKEYLKEYRLKNKERRREQKKKWYLKNKERVDSKRKEWCLKNKEHMKEYRLKNKEYIKEASKEWYLKNKEAAKARHKKWRLENKEYTKKYYQEYRSRPEKRKLMLDRINNRYRTDINYRLTVLCRNRVRSALKGLDKSDRTMKLIGCTPNELQRHMESQFEPWMTWENQGLGGWDIEHIKACTKFDLTCPEQQRACFNWSNLQPMEHIKNIKKGAR